MDQTVTIVFTQEVSHSNFSLLHFSNTQQRHREYLRQGPCLALSTLSRAVLPLPLRAGSPSHLRFSSMHISSINQEGYMCSIVKTCIWLKGRLLSNICLQAPSTIPRGSSSILAAEGSQRWLCYQQQLCFPRNSSTTGVSTQQPALPGSCWCSECPQTTPEQCKGTRGDQGAP